jgi:CRP-like cAMP-binding protein
MQNPSGVGQRGSKGAKPYLEPVQPKQANDLAYQQRELDMPKPFDPKALRIPHSSEIHALIKRLPDIEPLMFEDGEYLISQDEAVTDTFLVVSGNYVVEHSSAGPDRRPLRILSISSGQVDLPSFVGEMAYLGSGFRTASVRSSGPTYSLKIKGKHVDVIIAEFSTLTGILCKELTARLDEANEILKDLSIESRMVAIPAGELLVQKGEKAETLYQLVGGSLVRQEDDAVIDSDREYFGFVDPGPFFRDGEYEWTLKTQTACTLVAIPREARLAVIRNYPELALKLYQVCWNELFETRSV